MRHPAALVILSAACSCATAAEGPLGHAPTEASSRVGAPSPTGTRTFAVTDGGWSLPGAVQGWDAQFDSEGVSIGSEALTLTLVGYGRDEDSTPLPRAVLSCDGTSAKDTAENGTAENGTAENGCAGPVRFDRGEVEEWWLPVTGGLEQGWTLYAPAPGEGAVSLTLETNVSADVAASGTSATFTTSGRTVRYEGLVARDADGAPLRAWMEATETGLRVRVNDEGAAYPLTVDPILSTPDVLATVSLAGIGGGGDFNGDGYDDVVTTSIAGGLMSVYNGGAAGISTTPSASLAVGVLHAFKISMPGDVQGDGYDDVLVADQMAASGRGRIMLCSGSATGLQSPCVQVAFGSSTTTGLGAELSGIGDMNGDGRDDFAAGDLAGQVYVYRGNSSAAALQTSFTPASRTVTGESIGPAGDVNGDGYDDLAVGQKAYGGGLGAVSVFWGSASGISSGSSQFINYPWGSVYSSWCSSGSGSMGWAVSTTDLNGDGYGDVVASAPWDLEYCGGYTYVFLGSPSGAVTTPWVEGGGYGSGTYYIGYTLAGASDFNGDGYGDLGFGGLSFGTFEGSASPPQTILGTEDPMNATVIATLSAYEPVFYLDDFNGIVRTRRAGDTNGDGYDDFLVSINEGPGTEVRVYYGSP